LQGILSGVETDGAVLAAMIPAGSLVEDSAPRVAVIFG
jgi:hypothetical protein